MAVLDGVMNGKPPQIRAEAIFLRFKIDFFENNLLQKTSLAMDGLNEKRLVLSCQ